MDSYSFNDPIIYARRSGKSNDPFVSITESLVLDNSARVTLTEIPSEWHGLIVEGENQEWFEIKKGIPSSNQYIVDYPNRQVTFAQDHIGKQFSFSFMGTGNTFTSASSIYTERNGLEVTETLKTLTDSTSAARNEVIQTNNLVKANENERKQSEDTRKQNEQNRQAEHISMVNNTGYIEPYNANTTYKKNNIVTFNGASFMAKKQTKGNQPPNILVSEDNEFWGLLTRKGADGTGTVHVHRDVFTATEGQTAFTLTYTYDQFQNRTSVTVGGVPQRTPENYEETTSNTITLSEGVPAGTIIEVKYFSEAVPLQSDIQTTVDNHTSVISSYASRLNNHDNDISTLNTQMAQKAEQSDVVLKANTSYVNERLSNIGVTQINKNLGKIDQTYLTDELLQQIAGGASINAVPAREGITREHISSKSIDVRNLNFVTLSNNLFNPQDTVWGALDVQTGAVNVSSINKVSNFIYISGGQSFITDNVVRYCLYDKNFNFISGSTSNTINAPSNACYIRIMVSNANLYIAQLNSGNVLLPYDEYKVEFKSGVVVHPSFETVTLDAMQEDSVAPINMAVFRKPSNLFNNKNVTLGKALQGADVIDDAAGALGNYYIKVKPLTIYAKSAHSAAIAYYDAFKNYLSASALSSSTNTFTTPAGCHFIRTSIRQTSLQTFMLNEGSTVLPYEEHIYELVSTDSYPIKIANNLGGGSSGGGTGSELGEQWIEEKTTSVTASQTLVVCDISKPSEIDFVEVSSNKKLTEIMIYTKVGGANTLLNLLSSNGAPSLACTFENMVTEGTTMFEFAEYDTVTNKYKVAARDLKFAEGLRVAVRNNDTVAANVSVRVVGRSYENN